MARNEAGADGLLLDEQFLYLILWTDINKDACGRAIAGFPTCAYVKVDLVPLTVFPFLDVHIPAFCKVNNVVTSSMPVARRG